MELNTATLSDFTKNAMILFLKGLDSVAMAARNSGMFRLDPIPDNTGNTREYSEIDLEEYASLKGEGDQASRARVQQGYSKIGTLKRVAKDIGITYEMRHYNKYQDVVARLTNLGRLVANRMELDLSHRVTFATATSYEDRDGVTVDTTVGDTKALAATDHTVRGAGTTYRNRLANNPTFSRGSLEAMEKMVVENSINQFGEKVTIPYDIIFTTDDPNTVNLVREFLRSTASTDALNSGVVNVYNGKYKHVILPRVATDKNGAVDATKAKYWGLASSMNSSAFLGVNEEPRLKAPASSGSNAEEFSTEDWNFGAAAGYMIVVPGARWIALSTGDGTA
jgi:hypothetical protein